MSSFKSDVIEYLLSNGYKVTKNQVFSEDAIYCGNTRSIFTSPKGKKNNLHDLWYDDPQKLNKYCLEFIGPILKKHNITIQSINEDMYESTDWKFKNIRNIKDKSIKIKK